MGNKPTPLQVLSLFSWGSYLRLCTETYPIEDQMVKTFFENALNVIYAIAEEINKQDDNFN